MHKLMRTPSIHSIVILILAFAVIPIAEAQDFSERYDRLHAEAEAGDPDAIYELAVAYYLGHRTAHGGPEQDRERAVAMFRPLADDGDARAQWRLGHAYEMGSGVERDAASAYRWYSAAVEQDFVHAYHPLGQMYMSGRGTQQDEAEGYRLLRLGAEGNAQRAMVSLAQIYESETRGPEYDPALAVHWYRQAAEQNNSVAVRRLSDAYLNGHGVERDPVQAVRVYVEFEERSGREQTRALMRILGELSEEEREAVIAVGDKEDWLSDR